MKARIIPKTKIFTIIDDSSKSPKDWKVIDYIYAFNKDQALRIFASIHHKDLIEKEGYFLELENIYAMLGGPTISLKYEIFLYQIWEGKYKKRFRFLIFKYNMDRNFWFESIK